MFYSNQGKCGSMLANISQNNSNGVIPPAPTSRRGRSCAFKSAGRPDEFYKEKNDSFLHRNRGLFGFLAASLLCNLTVDRAITKKYNLSISKQFLYLLPLDLACGFIGQKLAESFGQKR